MRSLGTLEKYQRFTSSIHSRMDRHWARKTRASGHTGAIHSYSRQMITYISPSAKKAESIWDIICSARRCTPTAKASYTLVSRR